MSCLYRALCELAAAAEAITADLSLGAIGLFLLQFVAGFVSSYLWLCLIHQGLFMVLRWVHFRRRLRRS